jgi:hypothetical protein
MKGRLDALVRRTRQFGALALVLALIACGPGTGGTGSGAVQPSLTLTYVALASAAAGPVCGPADPDLRLEQTVIELRASCVRFVHEGEWSLEAGNEVNVAGTVEITSNGVTQSVPGSLRLQFDTEPTASRQLTVTVFDANGKVLAGPLTLLRQEGRG